MRYAVRTRLFALVDESEDLPRVKHYRGFPPELTGGKDARVLLPVARVIVLELKLSGAYLYRYAADASFGGETWHPTIDDAKHQARFEFGDAMSDWQEIPSDADDAMTYALARLPATK